jgi:hypothetical protein
MWEAIYLALLGVLGALITERLRARPKVIYYFPPGAFFSGDTIIPANLSADSVFIRNSGSKVATNIEVLLTRSPLKSAIRPLRDYTLKPINGGTLLQIGSLGPKEEIGIHLLTTPPDVAQVLWVRSDEGLAEANLIAFQKQYPMWVNTLVAILMIVGATTIALLAFPLFRAIGEAMVSMVATLTNSVTP